MTKDWLVKRVSRAEVDAELGMDNVRWVEIRSSMLDGDELWQFCSPTDYWKALCGRAGYCVLRGDEIVDYVLTVMN